MADPTTTGIHQLRKANTTLQKENAVLRRKNELLQHAADTSPRPAAAAGRGNGRSDSQMSSHGTGGPGTGSRPEHIDWRGKQPSFMRGTEASLQREDDTAARYHLAQRHASPAVEENPFVRREAGGKAVAAVERGSAVVSLEREESVVLPVGRFAEAERVEGAELAPVERYDSGPSSQSSPVPGSESSPAASGEESYVRGHDGQVLAVDEEKLEEDAELL
ncbi:hypothetical protein B0T25DRAFT_248873 [Lasiosphaeria hispida]|uniref:Uncharacterized protein n=1 Tax=Lasiosphaeria hispida TaxID=260671 RepID=A0AAJ0HF86_9PEZI|nr:hypothetical protein B0T25DRAFT_248873 [Lasiosphaeria hispida]